MVSIIRTIIAPLFASHLLFQPLPALSSDMDMNPYSATYKAKYNGIDITSTHQLVTNESGLHQETSEATSVFGKISESSTFLISDEGYLESKKYSFKRSLLGATRSEVQDFNWAAGELTYTKNSRSNKLPLDRHVFDMLTHKLQIRRDLKAGFLASSYPVMSRDKIKEYEYEIVGLEILETSIGPIKTTKIRRVVNSNKKRETVLWLANDWEFLTVKLVHLEKGESHQLDITAGQVGGKDITSLKRKIEIPL